MTQEEVQAFRDWVDDEGGILDLVIGHGADVFPEEIREAVRGLLNNFEAVDVIFQAYLEENGVRW